MKAEFPTPVEFVATLFISVLSSSESARYMNLENKQIRIFICPIKIQNYFLIRNPIAGSIRRTPMTMRVGYIALRACSGVFTAMWSREIVPGSSMLSTPVWSHMMGKIMSRTPDNCLTPSDLLITKLICVLTAARITTPIFCKNNYFNYTKNYMDLLSHFYTFQCWKSNYGFKNSRFQK